MRVMQPKTAFAMRGRFEVMSEALRQTIRELLREELQKIRKEGADSGGAQERITEETVSIANDQDLGRFVRRILTISKDPAGRASVEAGRHVFRLENRGNTSDRIPGDTALSAAGGAMIQIDKGVVTEKQAMSISDEVETVRIAKGVQLTPLASDAIRSTGKKIVRLKQ